MERNLEVGGLVPFEERVLSLDDWLMEVKDEKRVEWPYCFLDQTDRFTRHISTPHNNYFHRTAPMVCAWQSSRVEGIENSTDRLGEKFRTFIKTAIRAVNNWERKGKRVECFSFSNIGVYKDKPIFRNLRNHYDPDFYGKFKHLVRSVLGIEDEHQNLLPEEDDIHLDTNDELEKFFDMVDIFESRRIPFKFLGDHTLLLSSHERYYFPVKVVELFESPYGLAQGWMKLFRDTHGEEIYHLKHIVGETPGFATVLECGTYCGKYGGEWVDLWSVLRFAKNATNHVNQYLHDTDSLHEQQIERQLKKFFPNLLIDVYEFLINSGIDLDLLEGDRPSGSSSGR